ncbi:hypothetical protein HPP92_026520 [Vanilla planifolia]|uniref:ACT domain-containing protein ACR n=1 Tax=Vanilla planifolia TaxID=51239 RepID=A0A835PBU3_VANPL|nr:hypothetical protein HPP92_026748 [Vanilla planifolia]KAG0450862.1 hypothetical protein HPP92_026520 [Vanilla planifolia]
MGIPCDDVVQIRPPEAAGEPTVITINCPDKIGLGCDLCRVILFFGLSIVRGDASTDGKWCYVVFWVEGRGRKSTRWGLLKKRLLEACPTAPAASGLYNYYCWPSEVMATEQKPQVFLLKCCCYDRNGLLHDMTHVLCELEFTILKVKVSTTPDGRVINLFFITDTREFLHTRKRKEEAFDHLKLVLGDSITSFEIEQASGAISASLQPSHFLPPEISEEMFNIELPEELQNGPISKSCVPTVAVDNSLSPGHSLFQIICQDHKGLLYDVLRALKDYNIQLSYGRFYTTQKGKCEIDLFVVQVDGKKILDNCKQKAVCDRLRMEMYKPLRITIVSRGPDRELFVANPVELSGKGRPLVFHDVTLALKILRTQIFLAEVGRHVVSNRVWEVYRFLLEDDESSADSTKIIEGVTNMLMGWD